MNPNPFRSRPHSRGFRLALFAAILLPPLPAQPAPKEDQKDEPLLLSEFKVSSENRSGYYATNSMGASRTNTPIQDLPLSIQIITDELIRDMAALRVEDSLRYVSGVNLQNRNDTEDGGESYNIRGFRSRMLLRNGIPFNAFTDTVNILQIEVVKGPSSVLYGVSDPGGLINIVTKRPMTKPSQQVDLQFGTWDMHRASFDTTGPVTADKRLAYRLTGVYEEAGSFRRFVRDQRRVIDGALSFQVNSRNRVGVEYLYANQKDDGSSRRSYPLVRAGTARYFAPLAWFGLGFTSATPHDFQNLKQQFAETVWESSLTEKIKLRLAYAWTERDNDKFSNAQGTITAAGVMAKLPQREQYVFNQDNLYLDVLSKYELGATSQTTLVGAQCRNEKFKFYNALWGAQFGGPNGPPVRYLDPNQPDGEKYFMPPLAQMINIPGFNPQTSTTRTQGVFATHQIGLFSNRLLLTGGARYEDLKTRQITKTTPQIGAVYKVTPTISLFTSYNESFVPNTQINLATNKVYDPEEGTGADVGVKFELFNRRLVGTATFFEVEKTNVVNFNSRRDPGEPEYLLSGRLRTRGFEFDGVVSPTAQMQIVLSYAYHDAKELANEQFPDFVPYQLDNSSRNSAGLWGKYHVDQGPLKGLAFGAGYQYRHGPINLFPNGANRSLTQASYDRWDFYARYSWRLRKVTTTVSFNLKNAFDEHYMNKTGWWADPRNSTLGLTFEY